MSIKIMQLSFSWEREQNSRTEILTWVDNDVRKRKQKNFTSELKRSKSQQKCPNCIRDKKCSGYDLAQGRQWFELIFYLPLLPEERMDKNLKLQDLDCNI